jgi:hypothetical protein
MNDDQFDALVDNVTHAVNNLIPDRLLKVLSTAGRSDLLVQINDALTPILRDVIDQAGSDFRNPTRASTIATMISDLIASHIAKIDASANFPEDRPSHVISEVDGTTANINSVAICDVKAGTHIYLVLDDGATFRITVETVAS